MKGKKSFKLIIFISICYLFFMGVSTHTLAEEKQNYSDVRLELISEMERLKDEKKALQKKLNEEKDEKLKKALKIKIKAIDERILEIKKQLENYNNGITSVG
jgi:flagellar motility protein MotE (MotC chaperone)